jgi:hypothetical protein
MVPAFWWLSVQICEKMALRGQIFLALLRSFAPSSSRGLAKSGFYPFGSTLVFLNDAVTRVVTCFARVVTSFAGVPEKIFQHVFRFGVFSQ